MNNEKFFIDTDYTEINHNKNGNYYSLEDMVNILEIDKSTIVFWCKKFSDLLKIKSIGDYLVFDDIDTQNLKKIKRLTIDRNLSTEDTRKYINEHEDSLIVRKNSLPEQSILPILVQILKSQDKKINLMNETLGKMNTKLDNIEIHNQSIVQDQEQLQDKLDKHNEKEDLDIEEMKSFIKSLDSKLDSMNSEEREKNKELVEELQKEIQNISNEVTSRKQRKKRKEGLLNNIKNIFGI